MQPTHRVIAAQPGLFYGWPANNGLWSWDGGQEILVGCVSGAYDPQSDFHAIQPPYTHHLLRSQDGGETWQLETPPCYVGSGLPCRRLEQPLDFSHPGFTLRVAGDGYHGSADPRGSFYYSEDRGRTWSGPICLSGLENAADLDGLRLTPRTDIRVEDALSCTLGLSARPDDSFSDRAFCARTRDGGLTWDFLAWIVPPSDPFRAVMPATAACGPSHLVTAVRRRAVPQDRGWVDAYETRDGGASWNFLAKIGDTGTANGNPPALARLASGELCCVYGRRDTRQMVARTSRDEGRNWETEFILREDFYGERPDFGYPRLLQRSDGRLLAFYYWASREYPVQHIAMSLW